MPDPAAAALTRRAAIRSVNRSATASYAACGFAPPGPNLIPGRSPVLTDRPADRAVLLHPRA